MTFICPSASFALAALAIVVSPYALPTVSGSESPEITGDGTASSPMDAACKWVDNDGRHISLAPFKGNAPDYYKHEDNGFTYSVNLCGSAII